MPRLDNRCSFPREPVTACGVQLLTMWRVRADRAYHTVAEVSRHDSHEKIHQAGQNLVVVRTDGGEGVLAEGGRRHVLPKHSLLVFDFRTLEEYHTMGNRWSFWWVELAATEPLHLPLQQVITTPALPRETARCEEVFDKLRAEPVEQRHLAAAIWQGLFFEWWAAGGVGDAQLSHGELAMQRVVEAIKRDPVQPWPVEAMAKAGGLSSSTLRGACQQALGTTPAQLRIQLKLAHAHEYLRRGDRTVAEVAANLGFCDPYHFSKVFKRHYGACPSEMRVRPRVP